MISVLGVFALLQMTVLPGLLLTRHGRFDSGIEKAIAVFAASLLFNYFVVALLTACHQYRQYSLVALVVLELVLLTRQLWLSRRAKTDAGSEVQPVSVAGPSSIEGALLLAMGGSLVILGMAAWEWFHELGKVFESYDAIASWNRWAVEWSGNHWPGRTWNYPQLLPANWSLAYVLTNSKEGEMFARIAKFLYGDVGHVLTNSKEGELFARGLMGAFPLLVLLAIFDLQRRLRQPWLVISMAAAWFLMTRSFGAVLFDGYADAAVAALGFAGIYFQLLAREGPHSRSCLLAAAVCYGAACVTKQAGLCLTAGAVVWMFTDARLRVMVRENGRAAKITLGLLLACALHWYAIHFVISTFHLSTPNDEDSHLIRALAVNMHQGRDLLQRVSHGFGLIAAHFQPTMLCGAMAMLLLASLASMRGARLMLYFVLPGLLIWLLVFSYDIRNLAMAMPPAALAMGFGAGQMASWGSRTFAGIGVPAWIRRWGPVVLLAAIIAASAWVSDDRISTHYLKARRHAGDFRLNKQIAEQTGRDGSILTSYLQLQIQPGFSKRAVYFGSPLQDDADLQTRLVTHPWIVVEETLPAPDEAVRQRLLKNGTLFELAHEGGFVLYRNAAAKVVRHESDGQP